MKKSKVPLLFPIETANRELDFRLFLAAHCAFPDTTVYIGQSKTIFDLGRSLSGGIYLGKNLIIGGAHHNDEKYRELKKRGFRQIQLAEEGAIYHGGITEWGHQIDMQFKPSMVDKEDYVCAWGKFSLDHYLAQDPPCGPNIRLTGHPRFDLTKASYKPYYHEKASQLKDQYGKFILINSNFSYASNFRALNDCFTLFGADKNDNLQRKFWIDYFVYHSLLQTRFIQLASELAGEFPQHSIIFRPHPADDPYVMKETLKHVPRTFVVHDDSVIPWLAASDALIQNSCTTALEAIQLSPVIINYQPVKDARYDLVLPNSIGVKCRTPDEVISAIKNPPPDFQSYDPLIEQMICNFDNSSNSLENISGLVREALDSPHHFRQSNSKPKKNLASFGLRQTMRHLLKKRSHKNSQAIAKFTPLDQEILGAKIRMIETMTGKPLKWKLVGPDLLTIESPD